MSTIRSKLLRWMLFGSVLVTFDPGEAAAQPATVQAEGGSDAKLKELVRTGIAAYRSKDYAAARKALLEAIQISADSLAIGLLADTEMKLKQYRDAAEHWSIYLNTTKEEESSDRAEALGQLELCRKHVGSVLVSVQPGDAVVTVDGNVTDLTPTKGEIWLEPGTYRLEARSDSAASEPKSITIHPGEKLSVSLAVPAARQIQAPASPNPPPDVPIVPATAPPSPDRGAPVRTYVLLGEAALTLVAAGIGTAYWSMNSSAKNDADSASLTLAKQSYMGICTESNAPSVCADLRSANDRMTRMADVSQAAFVAAGVLGAVTIGTYLLWQPRRESTQQRALSLSPYWTPTNQGVTANVRF